MGGDTANMVGGRRQAVVDKEQTKVEPLYSTCLRKVWLRK